jgi:predicted RNase H-like HicB family nuclease
MKQKFTASIWQEDGWFVAQCVEVDVASQGKTEDEALENLRALWNYTSRHLSLLSFRV